MTTEIGEGFSKAVQDGYQEGKAIHLEEGIQNIVITGRGMSIVSGHILRDIAHIEGFPIHICEEDHLPYWVSDKTLVVILSFSGENEESISAFSEAMKKKARILLISKGGKLRELNRDYHHPFIKAPYDLDHISFIPFSFFALFRIFEKHRLLKREASDVQAISQLPQNKGYLKKAEDIAKSIDNRILLIYSSHPCVSAAWKSFFNFLGLACFSNSFHGMYYRDFLSFPSLRETHYFLFITDFKPISKEKKRLDALKTNMKKLDLHHTEISLTGKDLVINLFSSIFLGLRIALAVKKKK